MKSLSPLLSIGEAAAVKGVSIDTLRRWEKEGKIRSVRTEGGHRRYDIDSLIDFRENRKTVADARVSSHDPKNDLERQALVLEAYCLHHGYNFEIIKDLGSGSNYKKRGLQKILQLREAKIHCLKLLLHSQLSKSQINTELQQQFKINKRQANSIIAYVEGQVKSARECRSNHLE